MITATGTGQPVRLREDWGHVLATAAELCGGSEVMTSPVSWMLYMDRDITAVSIRRTRWLLDRAQAEIKESLLDDVFHLTVEALNALRTLLPDKPVEEIVDASTKFLGFYPGPARITSGGHPETGLFTGLMDASTLIQRAVMLRREDYLVEALYRLLEMLAEAYVLVDADLITGNMEPVGEEPPYWLMEKGWNLRRGWK